MAHVLLAATPFAGHVHPLAGVAKALVLRGHDVSFHTGVKYRQVVEAAGATWVGFQRAADFDDIRPEATFPAMRPGNGPRAMLSSFQQIFFGTAPGQAQDIMALHHRRPIDVMVAEGTCVGPSLVHDLTGIPYATMSLSPLGWGLPTVTRKAIDHTINRAFRGMHNTVRAELSLAPARRRGLEGTWSTRLVLAQGVPELEGPAVPEHARHVYFVGDAASGTRQAATAAQGIQNLPDDHPILYVSQGTLGRDALPLADRVIEAVADSGYHVVVGGTAADADPPPHVTTLEWVPQDEMFTRTDLFISNGGYGAVLAALGKAVPVVVVPGAQDKPLVAAAVARAGAGRRFSPRRASPATLRAVIDSTVNDQSIRRRAEAVSEAMRRAGGADRAAELVETTFL